MRKLRHIDVKASIFKWAGEENEPAFLLEWNASLVTYTAHELDQAQLPCSRTHSECAAKAEETCLKSCPVIKLTLTSTQFLTRYLYLDLHLCVVSSYNFHRKVRKAQLEKLEKNSSRNPYFTKHQGFHIKENLINAFQQERIQLDAWTL